MEFKKVYENGRELLEVELGQDVFFLDTQNWEFREKADPLNVISFHDMEYDGRHYVLEYNQVHKTSGGKLWYKEQEDLLRYEFRDMVLLHPEGVSERFGIPVEKLPATDADLKCSQERIDHRIKYGQLPKVMIGKVRLFADTRLMELRAAEYNLFINMDELPLNRFGSKMYFYFNEETKALYDVPKHLAEFPKNVVLVTLPPPAELDPVGRARRDSGADFFGAPPGDDLFYVDFYPIRDVVAGVFPLSQSPLSQHIDNCKMLDEENKQSKNKKGHKNGSKL